MSLTLSLAEFTFQGKGLDMFREHLTAKVHRASILGSVLPG